ncbi:MAG: hypothetical protein ACYS0G_16765 [Planctomycetota bacterium]|jgi:hypothetical protein
MIHRAWERRMLSAATCAVLVAAAGCALPSSRKLAVQWATPYQELGLVVVDPPQEDVRVGDVFVYAENPEPRSASASPETDRQRIGKMGRWMTLPVLTEVQGEYSRRPEWPQTPVTSAEGGERSWSEPIATGEQGIFAPEPVPNRLRDVALSGVSATVLGREEASALMPVELANLVPGTSFDDYKGITVTVSSAEMYSLALDSVLSLLVDEDATDDGARYVLKEQYRKFLPLMGLAESEGVFIRVVSEVVYMRSIDFVVQPAQPPDEIEDIPPPDMTSVRKPPPEAVVQEGDPTIVPFHRAVEINRLLMASNNARLPSGVSRVLSVTDKSASLRYTWSRGLAVAVRGLTLEVDKNTGAVLRLGATGAPLPKRRAQPATGEAAAS